MKKINSFKSGSVWLNVFETESGQQLATINRSYRKDGEWKITPFFNINNGDLDNIKKAIEQYEESVKEVVIYDYF